MIKNILKDSVVYGGLKYLSAFASIFLMPVYTRVLTKSDYGVMELFSSWSNFMIMVLPIGLITSIYRYYPEYEDNSEKKRMLGTVLLIVLAILSLYTLIGNLIRQIVVNSVTHYQINEIYTHSFIIIIGGVLISYFLTIAQSQFKKFKYIVISLINIVLLIVLGYIFVKTMDMGPVGFFRASTVGLISANLIAAIIISPSISLQFDKIIFNRLLKYSVHIVSVGLLFSAGNIIDRYILLKFGSLEQVGIYSIGVKISNFLGLITGAFSIAWFPRAMSIRHNSTYAKKTYSLTHNLYLIVTFFLLYFITLFRYDIIYFFARDYKDSADIIIILSLHILVNGLIYFYALGIHIMEKTKFLTVAAISSITINIISSILLYPIWGINGIAVGTLIGSSIWVIIQLVISQKMYPVRFNYYYLIIGFVALLVFYAISFLFDHSSDDIMVRITIKSLFFAVISIPLALLLRKTMKSMKETTE